MKNHARGGTLNTTHYRIADETLPPLFDGLKLVHLSDLHSARFGENQRRLTHTIRAENPDAIFFTGDMIDRHSRDLLAIEQLLAGIGDVAPIYAASGNHEQGNPGLRGSLAKLYRTYGVHMLENRMMPVRRRDETIYIGGLKPYPAGRLPRGLDLPSPPGGSFGLLLYHHSNHFELVAKRGLGYRWVFSGHTHGGIIRLPGVGGLLGNDMRLFPKYAGGVFNAPELSMVCSRGLSQSPRMPIPQLFNDPELVYVEFHSTAASCLNSAPRSPSFAEEHPLDR